MKKTILALCAISLLACNKDDENTTTTTTTSIVGKWQLQKSVVLSGKDSQILSEDIATDCEKKGYLTFNSNNTYDSITFTSTGTGGCVEDGIVKGAPYSYNGDTKKITIDNQSGDVSKITSSELEISEEVSDRNRDGVKDKEIFYFKKI
ncbi:lipocalin-like domain-containing protein [Flavobacterium oreochromis]|uniref:Lipocalin-like domain-containing protein n=1 Tax=Flavobacterium columnare TaxID=996 RepID=A0A246G839_9FLAO|nr:lipocalin family protein [Flavobacterium oreochromis]OWP74908.1 hypothetical protein BWK62_13185 [Flavobacterium oreochromis]POR22695.1 hypothetical protein BWK58_10740 [Flavobacterium columnare]